jgi:hypothetical protein
MGNEGIFMLRETGGEAAPRQEKLALPMFGGQKEIKPCI